MLAFFVFEFVVSWLSFFPPQVHGFLGFNLLPNSHSTYKFHVINHSFVYDLVPVVSPRDTSIPTHWACNDMGCTNWTWIKNTKVNGRMEKCTLLLLHVKIFKIHVWTFKHTFIKNNNIKDHIPLMNAVCSNPHSFIFIALFFLFPFFHWK